MAQFCPQKGSFLRSRTRQFDKRDNSWCKDNINYSVTKVIYKVCYVLSMYLATLKWKVLSKKGKTFYMCIFKKIRNVKDCPCCCCCIARPAYGFTPYPTMDVQWSGFYPRAAERPNFYGSAGSFLYRCCLITSSAFSPPNQKHQRWNWELGFFLLRQEKS